MPAQTRPICVSCGRCPCLARAERSAARAVAGAGNLELACADQRGRCRLQRTRRAAMARRSGFFCSGTRGRFQSCRWRWSCSRLWCSMLLMVKRALCTWVLLPLVETDPTSASFRCLRSCSHGLSGGTATPRRLSYADYAPSAHEDAMVEPAFRGPIRGPTGGATERNTAQLSVPDDADPHPAQGHPQG
jgi:hypothetical protein